MIYNGTLFKNKKFDFLKLQKFGFVRNSDKFIYITGIVDDIFELNITVNTDGVIDSRIREIDSNEEYDLLYVKNIEGEFVGKVKKEFENVLLSIRDNCTIDCIFKNENSYNIIEYIKQTYNVLPEYPWVKFTNNAIFRKNDNKWFAALLSVKAGRFGFDYDGEIEVINLKSAPQKIQMLIDNKIYFPAYHMNKKHWYSICLDNISNFKEIRDKIDESYGMV